MLLCSRPASAFGCTWLRLSPGSRQLILQSLSLTGHRGVRRCRVKLHWQLPELGQVSKYEGCALRGVGQSQMAGILMHWIIPELSEMMRMALAFKTAPIKITRDLRVVQLLYAELRPLLTEDEVMELSRSREPDSTDGDFSNTVCYRAGCL